MHEWRHVLPFDAIHELGCGIAGEHQTNFRGEAGPGEGRYHAEFILMPLAVTDA